MSTPVINAIAEVNDTSLDGLFTAVANNETARESLSQSDRNIDAVASNVAASEALGQSGEAVRLAVTRREGRDPANYPTLDDVAADQSLMADIAARQESSRLVMRCQEAAASCASSQPAMLETGKSSASLG